VLIQWTTVGKCTAKPVRELLTASLKSLTQSFCDLSAYHRSDKEHPQVICVVKQLQAQTGVQDSNCRHSTCQAGQSRTLLESPPLKVAMAQAGEQTSSTLGSQRNPFPLR
jgi:hypothetical protein